MTDKINLGRKFKWGRLWLYCLRAFTKTISLPFWNVRECAPKRAVRRFILHFQNSLPTEIAVGKGDCAVQIGTPRPRTVMRFSKAAGPEGMIFIFEAESKNFQRLSNFVESNELSNVTLINAAAWSESKTGELLLSPYEGDHKILVDGVSVDNDLRKGNQDMKSQIVEFLKIDDVTEEKGISRIDYLSVTVNGAEHEVLKGAEEILRKSPDARVYAKGHSLNDNGEPLNIGILEFLESLGFTGMITKGEPSSTMDKKWRWRAGDVYAWKQA